MKTLILMRHAKAEPQEPGQDDFDRPLSPRGVRDARALGDWLRTHDHLPAIALVSAARRTRETWEGLALGPECPVALLEEIYGAAPATLIETLKTQTADSVLMVGHNPEMATLAAQLLRGTPGAARVADFPTGATAVIGLDTHDWRALDRMAGRLVDYVTPRDLRD